MPTTHAVLGAGPLGLSTLQALQQHDVPARVFNRRRPVALAEGLHASVDLTDTEQLCEHLRGCSVAYFCAQPPYHRWQREFATLLRSVLLACERSHCALMLADNLYGYGLPAAGQPLTERTPARPETRKGIVRAAMASNALAAHAAGKLQVAIVRASDFFGPGVRASALGERVWQPLLQGRAAHFSGDPDQPHSYAYIDDFAAALAHLGVHGTGWGQVWHAPHQPALNTRELLQRACARAGLDEPRIVIDGRLMLSVAGLFVPAAREVIEMLPQFELPYRVDDSKLLAATGLGPTPLDSALDATLAWYGRSGGRSMASEPTHRVSEDEPVL